MYLGIRIYSRTVRTAHRVLPLLVVSSFGLLHFAISCSQSNHISLHMDVKERTRFYRAESTVLYWKMVGLIGLEPMTPALSRRCSNQLSYRPLAGFGPQFEISNLKFEILDCAEGAGGG